MKKVVLLILLFSLSAVTFMSAQSKLSQKEVFATTYQNSKTVIKTQNYQFHGAIVYNKKQRQKLEGDFNRLKIVKDKISCNLNSLNTYKYSTNESNNKITDYKVSYNDDVQEIIIEFNVGKDHFLIDIKPNGNAFLTLKSGVNNITQTGKIERI